LGLGTTSDRLNTTGVVPRSNAAAKRRHERLKPLWEWETKLRRLEKEVRESMTTAPGAPTRKQVVAEVLRLTDPHAVSWADVVIPGGRDDLARKWIAARLAGRGADETDWVALVREMAASPDDGTTPYKAPGEPLRYRTDRFQREVTKAAEEFFRDRPPLA
jgi:hypothetical protein